MRGVGSRDPVVRGDSQRLKKQLCRGRASGPKWVSAVPQISWKAQPLAVHKALGVRLWSKPSKAELITHFPGEETGALRVETGVTLQADLQANFQSDLEPLTPLLRCISHAHTVKGTQPVFCKHWPGF